jgi:hypothetical protein
VVRASEPWLVRGYHHWSLLRTLNVTLSQSFTVIALCRTGAGSGRESKGEKELN